VAGRKIIADIATQFDTSRGKKKLLRYVQSHDYAIDLKTEIMADHFHEQVLGLNKFGGLARLRHYKVEGLH
jgi:type I restriction enzyme R subunit